MSLETIQQEIIDEISINVKKDEKKLKQVLFELEYMSITEGLEGKNNLETFYSIRNKYKEKKGHENKINSWTAYYLGMTDKKPEGDFLPSRRAFARAGFPDIDIDFDTFRRKEVIDYIKQKYGEEYVSSICTYNSLSMKSCLTRVVKALDIAGAYHLGPEKYKALNNDKVREIVDKIPKAIGGFTRAKDENGEQVKIKKIVDAVKHFKDFKFYIDQYPQILEHSKNIEGMLYNASVHPAGVVVSNMPLETIAPVRNTKKGLATQYVYEDLEKIGEIKIDILALKTLSVVDMTMRMIKENYGIDVDIENLPADDQKSLELFNSGLLAGVFQCEGYQMQEVMKEVGVSRIEDVIAVIALYRPGPMANIPEYVARKHGQKIVDYFHPSIEKYVKPILEKTYGIAIYQEQIMKICNALGGLSIIDGYVLIKGIGKKKINLIEQYKNKVVAGAMKNGVPKDVITIYWERFIIPFASYGFNESHCLTGDMKVKDKISGKFYSIEELYSMKNGGKLDIVLDSFADNHIVEDGLLDVFETGEKEVFEIELDNGIILKSTLDHKFYCTDGEEHKVSDILENGLEIIYFWKKNKGLCKIKSIKPIGIEKTYNLTMKSEQHNYSIYGEEDSNGFVISKNSASYAYLSLMTAYLKVHYPEEFFCSLLNVEAMEKKNDWEENIERFTKDAARFNIVMLPKNLNTCDAFYKIVKKKNLSLGVPNSEIMPGLLVKDIGLAPAKIIEQNKPYAGLRDFAYKTDLAIDKQVFTALIDNGFFSDYMKRYKIKTKKVLTKEALVQMYMDIKEDKKKMDKKGIVSTDLLG